MEFDLFLIFTDKSRRDTQHSDSHPTDHNTRLSIGFLMDGYALYTDNSSSGGAFYLSISRSVPNIYVKRQMVYDTSKNGSLQLKVS